MFRGTTSVQNHSKQEEKKEEERVCWEREDCDSHPQNIYVLVASPVNLTRASHLDHACRFRLKLRQFHM